MRLFRWVLGLGLLGFAWAAGCGGSEAPGLLTHIELPLAALPLEQLVLTVESSSGTLPMRPDATDSGVVGPSRPRSPASRFTPGCRGRP